MVKCDVLSTQEHEYSEIHTQINFSMYFEDKTCHYYGLCPKFFKMADMNCSTETFAWLLGPCVGVQ